ncbi:MAG: Gfo/Idh/MocA family oxidoreductase [Clostridia bacterium]|nr:Gfo/Idh/MocA family oxidoreductase [Clostridia bacterium]
MLKVCIIGCGMIAESAHIPAYKSFPEDYTVTAIFDVCEEKAKALADKVGCKYYTDADKMLDVEKPDVVSVCVPNCFHKEYTMKALHGGASVICEKPLAVKYSDACEMFDTAEKQGKVLMACQSMRFTSDRAAAKKYMTENPIGSIYYAEFSRIRKRGIPFWGNFHKQSFSLGGAMCDIGVHMLDALVWLMGDVKIRSVSGTVGQNHKNEISDAESSGAFLGNVASAKSFCPDEMDVEDFASGSICLENGGRIGFKTAWAANIPDCTEMKIVGTEYGIDLPSLDITAKDNGKKLNPTAEDVFADNPFGGHRVIIDNMRRVLHGKAQPIVSAEETKTVSAILEMFYLSAKEGREVLFDEITNNGGTGK